MEPAADVVVVRAVDIMEAQLAVQQHKRAEMREVHLQTVVQTLQALQVEVEWDPRVSRLHRAATVVME